MQRNEAIARPSADPLPDQATNSVDSDTKRLTDGWMELLTLFPDITNPAEQLSSKSWELIAAGASPCAAYAVELKEWYEGQLGLLRDEMATVELNSLNRQKSPGSALSGAPTESADPFLEGFTEYSGGKNRR